MQNNSASFLNSIEETLWNSDSGEFSGEFNPPSLGESFGLFAQNSVGSINLDSLGGLASGSAFDNGGSAAMEEENDEEAAAPQQQQQQQQAQQAQGGRMGANSNYGVNAEGSSGRQEAGGTFVMPGSPPPRSDVPAMPSQDFAEQLTPNMSATQGSMALLNKIYYFQRVQRQNLGKLRALQRDMLARGAHDQYGVLVAQEQQMSKDTRDALQALVHLWSSCMLSPVEIARWDFLYSDLQTQLLQLSLYLDELRLASGHKASNPLLSMLAVIEQPFPCVVTRGKKVEGRPVVVQLLTGASVNVLSTGAVQSFRIVPEGTKGKVAEGLVEPAQAALNEADRTASFIIKVTKGTRKQPVMIGFRLQCQIMTSSGAQMVMVGGMSSAPFISVTNEVQWEEAEGILIANHAFQHQSEIAWIAMVNHLQRHIVPATRQELMNLQRIFSQKELNYFNQNFFHGQSMVSREQVETWWRWYGKTIHRIRYTKHVLPLYLSGLLFSYVSRQEMEVVLRNQPPGTFMVRFSERNVGSFSLAYVTQDRRNPTQLQVRHYLLGADDITQRKSIVEFLADSSGITHFLRYIPASGFNLAPSPSGPHLRYERVDKHLALKDLYHRKETQRVTSGYDSELNPQPPVHVLPASATAPLAQNFASPLNPASDFNMMSDYWDAE